MIPKELKMLDKPKFNKPRLLLGFSGWMDGGEVSPGTLKCLIEKVNARKFAEIDPRGFYIYSFPAPWRLPRFFALIRR